MDQTTSDSLRRLEENLWHAETRFDRAKMDMLFAPDLIEFGRSGRIYTRSQLLPDAGESRQINATLPLTQFAARFLSKSIAQVTYISEVHYGGTLERSNRSSIWGRNGEGWQLRFHQGTPIK